MKITTLIIDWGDTLMENFPGERGPMVSWPRVAALPGARETLAALRENYRFVLATNAAESRSFQVRQALARVGLDEFFSAVFTSAELGARKPEPGFYSAIQSVLGAQPAELLMIGDSYRIDVLGARNAGWSAAWFNPARAAAPALLPQQDLELPGWPDLPARLEAPFVPGYAQSVAWLLAQPMSANLLAHVHAVAAVAYQLAVWLRAAGQLVDPLLAHRGGLLHDLAKLKALQRPPEQRIGHAELGALLLKDIGQPLLAEVARRHPLFALNQANPPRSWEEKLVYFADKVVEGARVAGIEDRIQSLRQRYPDDDTRIAAMIPALDALQAEICAALAMPPAELSARLKTACQSAE